MFKKIKNALFSQTEDDKTGKGLYATIDELFEQRKYIHHLRKYQEKVSKTLRFGDIKSAFKGRGIEFEEIREYNFGDDVRDIDWRVTARKLSPYTKIYNQERDREIYVFLDLSSSMAFGTRQELKSVTAAKIASLLGWVALENNDRFGAVIFDGEQSYTFKPKNSRENMMAILKKLSDVSRDILKLKQPKPEVLNKTLQALKKNLKSQAVLFFIGDFMAFGETIRKTLGLFSKHSSLYCIEVMDILEESAPLVKGEYMIRHGRESLIFNTDERQFVKEYQEHFIKKRNEMRSFCRKFGMNYMTVRTDIPIYRQIKI